MRMAGYIRVSRRGDRTGPAYISPDVQRDKITGWANLHDVILDETVVEEDVSGATKVDERELGRLLERCEHGELAGVIVHRVDRFGRSTLETLEAVRRLRDSGARLVGVADGVDSAQDGGRLVITILAALAEDQLDRIRAGWAEAQERAIRRGVHIARPPFGYQRSDGGPLEPDPDTAPLVAEAFRRRAAGASLTEIARYLDEQRPGDARRWTHAAVKRLLSLRAYTGAAFYGDHENADAHPAIVTPEAFQAVQRHTAAVTPLRQDDGALLAGILRCAGCRRALQRTVPTRGGYREYRCRRHYTVGDCQAPATVRADRIEEYVTARFLAELKTGVLAESTRRTDELDKARIRLDAAETELRAWVELGSVSELGQAAYLDGLRARRSALDVAQQDVNALTVPDALPRRRELLAAWPTLPTAARRKLLAAGLEAVFLRGGRNLDGRVYLAWRTGGPPLDLPRRGTATPLVPFVWD